MASAFVIQASNPRLEFLVDGDDRSLSDAIQGVFPRQTERMLLIWNTVCVALSYKYDISLMVDDVLDLVDAMLDNPSGSREIHWPSNTFAASWDVRWGAKRVTVVASWSSVVGRTEGLLAESGSVSIPVEEFLAEWKRPLEIVFAALRRAGYTQEQIPRLSVLGEVLLRLPHYGQLYAASPDSDGHKSGGGGGEP